MSRWLTQLYAIDMRLWRWLGHWLHPPRQRRWSHNTGSVTPRRRIFAQPKPEWVKTEVIHLKALMPQAGCRMIAHHFNRRWRHQRQMTVSKTYVADTCRKHRYQILHLRRRLKHRIPRPMRRNRVWGCDLLTKTGNDGRAHLALAIVDHASRACLRLQSLSDKSSLRLLHELVQTMKRYGRPQCLRTDNEAVFVSRWFRLWLCLFSIRNQRIQPGCPWQNGRVERFIGTVKRELAATPVADGTEFGEALREIRAWYNHERPHDHLQGQTPAEVWAGIDVPTARSWTTIVAHRTHVRQESG